ncbi:class I SAM-dependent methyltransferase [Roseovarius sp.]|uniref:class I SAM-dependent methyltransferase n=1 Tax=Roseovarius sp. TaxID=1486281 RepID=UPI003BA85A4F
MPKDDISPTAALWGSPGAAYERISFGLNDGLGHAVQALWPRDGERVLDIGTGTGRAARMAAEMGAEVTGVDIAAPLLEAARELSAHLRGRLSFRQAEAEALPFEDAAFDGVLSTYGVMFASQPKTAAAELARVTRPGGRMVLLTWLDDPEGYIATFFGLAGRYSDAPPPEVSPMDWGDEDWIEQTLAGDFDLACQPLTTTLFAPDAETVWEEYLIGFGPVRATAEGLSADRRADFREEFIALHDRYRAGHGLRIERKALLVHGLRR